MRIELPPLSQPSLKHAELMTEFLDPPGANTFAFLGLDERLDYLFNGRTLNLGSDNDRAAPI